MSKNIAVAGKGGTGKTTFCSLVVRYLISRNRGAILAIDADPNANLNEALGLVAEHHIADVLEETKDPKAVPSGMTKDLFIEYKLSQAIVETQNVDLLVMGRPQGPGCYCYPNDLLRKHMETLSKNYDYLVVDNEAGLEHISRRTIQDVSHLFVISDASARGVRSAGRVRELVEEMKLKVGAIFLVITKVNAAVGLEPLQQEIAATGIPFIGTIPLDPQVAEFDMLGKPLFELPEDAAAWQAAQAILDKARV